MFHIFNLKNLYAIKRLSKYLEKDEMKNLLTSLYYFKLYYGTEVWHLPQRTSEQNRQLKYACDFTVCELGWGYQPGEVE